MIRNSKTSQRERLTREAVATQALAIADREGLDGLTIRRLAADLSVTPMALYWHFADKDALMSGVVEQLLTEVTLPAVKLPDVKPELPGENMDGQSDEQSDEWSDELHALLTATLGALREHPRVARLVKTQMLTTAPGLAIAERALQLLRSGGFDTVRAAQLASHALSTIIELVVSEPGVEVDVSLEDRAERIRQKKARLHALPPDAYPSVVASIDALTSCKDQAGYYDLGLEIFIAGVRAVQPATVGAAHRV